MFESRGIKVKVSERGDGRQRQQYGCRETSRRIHIKDNAYTGVKTHRGTHKEKHTQPHMHTHTCEIHTCGVATIHILLYMCVKSDDLLMAMEADALRAAQDVV